MKLHSILCVLSRNHYLVYMRVRFTDVSCFMRLPKIKTNSRWQCRVQQFTSVHRGVIAIYFYFTFCAKRAAEWSAEAVSNSLILGVLPRCSSRMWRHVSDVRRSISTWTPASLHCRAAGAGSHLFSALKRHCNIHMSNILPFPLCFSFACQRGRQRW